MSGGGWQDSIDDFSDIDEGRWRVGRRTKLALLIAGVAAVVVVGLAIGRAVLVGDTPTTSPSTGSSATSAPSGVQPAELLNDDAMLNAKDAKRVSSDRTWKVASTQSGTTPESATPACLGQPAEGQPMSALTMLRLLSANGKEPPGVLHQADAFATPDEAGQAFAVAAKTLGGCPQLGAYVQSGWSVTGLGDQAVGLVVVIGRAHHSVVLNRTGRVTNVMDVARNGSPVEVAKVANALAAPTAVQCRNSGGACPKKVSVKPAPPPIGGDVPGFLAAGDLPPVAQTASLWVGDVPDVPRAGFAGSQCENVDWAKSPASARTARTYLLDQGPDPAFGLDEIILTMKNDATARKFVANLRTTVEKCPKRKLTASVRSPKSISGLRCGRKEGRGLGGHGDAEGEQWLPEISPGCGGRRPEGGLHLPQPQGKAGSERRRVAHGGRSRRAARHSGQLLGSGKELPSLSGELAHHVPHQLRRFARRPADLNPGPLQRLFLGRGGAR